MAGIPPLPPGWEAVPSGHEYYFWNRITNETTWQRPAPVHAPRAGPPPPAAIPPSVSATQAATEVGMLGMARAHARGA